MSIRVQFTDPKGNIVQTKGQEGDELLRVGQAAGLPLEGTCEGQMACSTCHVIVADEWFDKLTPARDPEEDMLDFAAGVRRTSRLACQINLTPELDGLKVNVPGEARDARSM